MNADDFRRLALEMTGAIESAHMGHPDFRAGGRIFATLSSPDQAWGMVKLTPEQQEAFVSAEPDVFAPVKGGWGRGGATNVRLEVAKTRSLRMALTVAWRNATGGAVAAKSRGKLNAKWHAAHPMGKNPTEAERVRWHVAHAKACACRGMPAGVRALLRKHGVAPSGAGRQSPKRR